MTPLPLAVDLRGRRVLVVGAGGVGARKAATLLDHGAHVLVVAPEASEPVLALARAGRLGLERREYAGTDLQGAFLAVAATSDPAVNGRVADDADRRGVLCVRADGGGAAAFMAGVTRGDLLIGVSTGGNAPALAARIRDDLEAAYGHEYAQLADLLGRLRRDPSVQASLARLTPGDRAAAWRHILDTDILHHLRTNDSDRAREVATACLSSSSD